MKKFIIPSKDTTIYQAYPTNNAGFDEILEIGKVGDTSLLEPEYSASAARALLYFDLPTTVSVSSGSNFYLNLRIANATEVKRNQKILVYQVSQSWEEGSGYFYQDVKNANDGATWQQTETSVSWSIAGASFLSASTSASYTISTYPMEDIRIDVTNILRPIVSQSLQSTFLGLLLKFPTADELDENNIGNIKVFSAQTHTIHQPTLEIAWDNQRFISGSTLLVQIPTLDVKITPNNLKETYTKGDVTKLTLNVRDLYPIKAFDSTLRYKNKYYLPTSSYYSIVDVQSNTTIVQFDEFSKINSDTTGSYVVLDTNALYPGRFYTLKFKVDLGDYSKVINTDTLFKVL
jgi:hypothetical protein